MTQVVRLEHKPDEAAKWRAELGARRASSGPLPRALKPIDYLAQVFASRMLEESP